MDNQRNIILAVVLCIALVFGFDFAMSRLYPQANPPQPVTARPEADTPTERAEPASAAVEVKAEAKATTEVKTEPCETAGKDDTKMSDLVQRYKEDVEREKALAEVVAEPEPEPEPEIEPEVFVPRPGGITARPLPPPVPPTPPAVTMKRGGIGG